MTPGIPEAKLNSPNLSLCMIVKDEEHNLERCLASVQGIVDEIILVDTGSTDRSVEIAKAHGAKVFHHAWQNDYAQARNVSLEQANGDWILYLDADEELELATRPQIKPLLSTTDADAINIRWRNFMPPNSLTEYNDVMQVRLWRNRPAYRFIQSVHEQITPSILRANGKIIQVDTLIWLHYGGKWRNVQGGGDRDKRNLALLEQAVAQSPQNAYLSAKLGVTYYNLGDYSQAYAHLRRVFGDLDSRELGIDSTKEALFALAAVALRHQHFSLAIQSAQACADIAGEDTAALLLAMDYLSQAHIYQGEEHLRLAEQAGQQSVALDHLQQGRIALQQAQGYLTSLNQHPHLNPAVKAEVEANLKACQKLLRATAERIEAPSS